jgi:hypothetical protein
MKDDKPEKKMETKIKAVLHSFNMSVAFHSKNKLETQVFDCTNDTDDFTYKAVKLMFEKGEIIAHNNMYPQNEAAEKLREEARKLILNIEMKSEDAVEIMKWVNDKESNLEEFERKIEQLKETKTIEVHEKRTIREEIKATRRRKSKAKSETKEVKREVKIIKDEARKEIKQLRSQAQEIDIPYKWWEVPVLGFNSACFDANLLNKYLNCEEWHIMNEGLMNGGISKFQKLKVKNVKTGMVLVFFGAKRFVEGGSLDNKVRNFVGNQVTKGMAPYEAINKEYVKSTEIFPLEDFKS